MNTPPSEDSTERMVRDNNRLTHRPVQESDLPQICAFPETALELFFMFPKASFPLTVEQIQEAIASRTDSTVVELEGTVVGFANFYHWEQGGRCAIGNVVVAPSARRKGVGQYLVNAMCAIATHKYAATEITVSCFNGNTSGLLLYPKLGFLPYAIETRLDKEGGPVALIHMRKNCGPCTP